ncbi:oxidoreductase-like domain-containing protein [Bordetella petrii]|uniref:oxidoreductase-like domain-containing protein n=1 Tax=Bordetella petrii TaxID=94624 RepID=UPI001A97AF34|nr:oxidoreductase-like domain-containing protein [Bordetella petrii]MBO1112782.1 oxidoreductase [Bordetella petrii]
MTTAEKTAATPPAPDPEPVPPEAPAPGDCCQSGCIPCVYDLYDEAMDRYREALRAWRARHGVPPPRAG